MALVKRSEPWFMTAAEVAQREYFSGAVKSELALRNALERFCRDRWPEARICHEMVMGEGKVRADVVAIDPAHIAAFEIKGSYDTTTRLLHQVGMYQLCVPEVWMVVAENHEWDAKLIRHLLPSVGLLVAPGMERGCNWPGQAVDRIDIRVEAEAAPRPVVPQMMLEMLWATELREVCRETGTRVAARATRGTMVKGLLASIDVERLQRECCRALRGRDALWRADDPVVEK